MATGTSPSASTNLRADPLRLIPLVGPSVGDASALSASVRGLEDFGYDALWVGDRQITPVDVDSAYLARGPQMTRSFEPMLLLTVAAATSRVRLNTSTLSTFYCEPPHLARLLTTLDVFFTMPPVHVGLRPVQVGGPPIRIGGASEAAIPTH